MVAAALKHLGGSGATAQTTSSQYTQSKERSKQAKQEDPSQSLKVKRNSNMLTSNGGGGVASKVVSN